MSFYFFPAPLKKWAFFFYNALKTVQRKKKSFVLIFYGKNSINFLDSQYTYNHLAILLVADLKETKHEAFQISMVIVIGVKFTSNRNLNQKHAKEVKV